MRHKHVGTTRVLAAGAVLALMTVTPSAIAAGRGSTPASDNVAQGTGTGGGHPATHTVTLLTGDRVTVTSGGTGPDSVTVVGPNGHRADARITTQNGDTYVFPSSADPYVAAGRLDKALFDVTRLIADGFDDAHVKGLPLIVGYGSPAGFKAAARTPAAVLPDGASAVRPLESINSTALTEDRDSAHSFWASLTHQPAGSGLAPQARATGDAPQADSTGQAPALAGGITKIWLDGKVKADLADSTAQIGAPEVWAGGNTGRGVDVAVLDTGYDPGHPDLGAVTSSESFVPGEDVTDRHGHGTHVASTIAGSGAASDGKERGVAPDVSLHVGKVLSNSGQGLDSWIISGMEWAARDAKARVISMSLGTDMPTDGTDPLSQAVNQLSEETGALFTVAAGNTGYYGDHTVAAPGSATDALTVGAVDSSDAVADFSSRGPRLRDDAPKPEITAPGVDILAARSQYAPTGSGPYTTMSGTSMATPHVAGVAALVAAAHPDWTGSMIKDALISSAHPTPDNPADAGGNGRVDAVAAATGTLFATGTVDAGIHSLGGAPGETVDKQVQWHNAGTEPVTVDLAVDAPDAPTGLFTVADPQVTVPAGGTVSTTVTTHLDKAPAGHHYTGRLTASAGGKVRTRTLLSVSTQEEYHHLRVHITDRSGAPVSVLVNYQRKGDEWYSALYSQNGVLDTVVEPGQYTVWAWVAVKGTHGDSSAGLALLSAPSVTAPKDSDVDYTLDGTRLRPTRVVTPKTSTDSDIRVDYVRTYAGDVPPAGESRTVGDGFDSLWALPTAKPADGNVTYTARWRMQRPQLALSSGDQNFDDLWLQPGAADPADGDRTLPAVYEGKGTPEDYAAQDAKGKVAVVTYVPDDDFAAATVDQVKAAEQAGVAVLVMVNDQDGRLREPVRRTALTVAGISRTEGQALIDRIRQSPDKSVPMRVVGHNKTGYLYDLVHSWHDAIPGTMVYAPAEGQLARVDVDFRNDPALEVDEFRYDIQPYLGAKVGGTRLSHAGEHRTDWVTADKGTSWMEEATAGIHSFQYSGQIHYPAGKTTAVTWFGPVERPRVNDSQPLPQRTGNSVQFVVPGFGDGGEDHAGTVGFGTTDQETSLYSGDTEIVRTGGYWLNADVPAAKDTYRLVTTTQRTGYPYSTSTRTEWGFTSAAPHDGDTQLLPLIQLDYTIATSTDGKAERDADLVVTPTNLPGVSSAVRTETVELSYDDGATWQQAKLSGSSQGARLRLHAPATADYLTLRVHASDRSGDTVTQTVVRAVGLR
ncbi:S8 family serine peptidase [Streptomyces brasiliensis]|uniref:Peptidase n=1 Tax=Streptomyces brasiliensis TaxID=1954 RepID=A0A917UJZ7_9ACTN|nr:S8 family serine peptidase [Streptomyces brasiliensis]GGJ63039.1 peptidase [Streptomyces brasiliensis]